MTFPLPSTRSMINQLYRLIITALFAKLLLPRVLLAASLFSPDLRRDKEKRKEMNVVVIRAAEQIQLLTVFICTDAFLNQKKRLLPHSLYGNFGQLSGSFFLVLLLKSSCSTHFRLFPAPTLTSPESCLFLFN